MASFGSSLELPPGRAFERRVGMLFELLGFRVESNRLIAGRQIDLFLEDRSGVLARQYIVECKDQANPVTTAQYDAFRGRLLAARYEMSPKLRGIIVASVGFVKEAKAHALREDIELLTISELETSVIDFRQYVRDLIRSLADDSSLTHFVAPRLVREHRTVPETAMAVVEAWLADPEANQLTVLGDYGTGKTTFLKHLSLVLARGYETKVIEGGARGRVPIFVDLKEYTQALSLKQIVLDLLDNHGIRAASYAAFEHVLREGQVLMILDGFDEMANRGNYHVTLRNFRELNRSALGRAKIILSCRSHYFTDQREIQQFLGQSNLQDLPVFYTDLYREIAGRPNFSITYLQEFDSAEVGAYLESRCGDQAATVRNFITNTYNLEELSHKPVLLDMIVSSADSLSEQPEPVTPGILYRIYTDIWLSRNDWSTILDVETKRQLLERFAAKAIFQRDAQLHYSEIPPLIRSLRQGITDVDEQEIDRELRTASFLVRNQAGEYRFSHRSFLEFFYARHLRSEIYRFIQDLMALSAEKETVDRLLEWAWSPAVEVRTRGNAIKCVARVQERQVARMLVQILMSSDDVHVRQFAATALGYQHWPEVVPALISVARRESEETHVLANSLLALARLGTDEAISFLLSLLERGPGGKILLQGLVIRMVFRAAHATPRMDLVRACIQYARRWPDARKISRMGLKLCSARRCEEGDELCREVLASTKDLGMAVSAFASLSSEWKGEYLDAVIGLADRHPKRLEVGRLVRAMLGLGGSRVAAFLVALIEDNRGRFAVEALEIVANDFPNIVAETAPRWLQQRGLQQRSHVFRLQVAKAFVRRRPAGGGSFLRALYTRRQRATIKRGLLDLCHSFYPEEFGTFVREIWNQEPATLIKRHALELLLQVDKELAIELMLGRGVRENRVGTRVAVCMILASINEAAACAALLERLRDDPSRWVRIQALRSLVSPGRAFDRRLILEATLAEKDPGVLAVRMQLLGASGLNE
ncbi:MAG: NACHT domain-containing protein [Fimbriimonadales bacterium]